MLDNIVGNGLAHSVGEAAFVLWENAEYLSRFLIIPAVMLLTQTERASPFPTIAHQHIPIYWVKLIDRLLFEASKWDPYFRVLRFLPESISR